MKLKSMYGQTIVISGYMIQDIESALRRSFEVSLTDATQMELLDRAWNGDAIVQLPDGRKFVYHARTRSTSLLVDQPA